MPTRDASGRIARDPVSELFDGPARRLLERAYAQPGQWTSTRLANPSASHVAWAAGMGINVLGADPAQTDSGAHLNARSAWARAFVRAVYHQHRWYFRRGRLGSMRNAVPATSRAVRFQVGRLQPALGVIPAGRQVSIMVMTGGQAARRAVRGLPESHRIYGDDGRTAGAWADPELRVTWEQ